jgi:hypothetical protein
LFEPIAGLGRDDVANAAPGVRYIARVSGNNVEVKLGNGLAGGEAVVEAEVEGVGCGVKVRRQVVLGPVYPYQKAGLFGAGQLLVAGDRTASDD